MPIFKDKIVNNEAFKHLVSSLLKPGTDEIELKCKNLNFIFSKINFKPTGMYILSFQCIENIRAETQD